jgi:uncharacterized protein with HEPN domain
VGCSGCGNWIQERIGGHTFQDYLNDQTFRFAVERQFIVLGEVLSQFARANPGSAESITEVRQVIAFRNVLVHGYSEVDDRLVWTIATSELDSLIESLDKLLRS